ncbi:peptidoglycan/xylan/chitin deacetylase (PgdA/CDA1 family) [Variovorax boronicumulans]|uniref:polysaccharide deacetylase family protein n=1 Tax=Variovorax boronicumulans TaxID=436515 RepID=UPI002782E5E7|nr:polysaccharide deacetylase family protein [Variovorax boronicumulans]MDP9910958.1 peptidoglycan/xylan/chitin deacetylase (PgdA/CDA1 family) [Variovorax boronicumulans]
MKVPVKSLLALAVLFSGTAMAFQWPANKKSAVSITADDGWPSQLTQAAILDARGLKGTFYLTAGGMPPVSTTNQADWAQVYQRGHEIGNHSYSHWSDQILATKTWQDVAGDVGAMEWWLLQNIYGTPVDHTYAYPQGNYVIGSQATNQSKQVGACEYAGLLTATVSAARVAGTGENKPADVARRRFYISGLPISGSDATAVNAAKQAIDNGIAKGTWTVLVFHSLGDNGDGYSVSPSAYTQIADYLVSRQADLYVAPVVTVKNYVAANTPAADWTCALQ